MSVPEISREHQNLARQIRARARRGWFLGTQETAAMWIIRHTVRGVTEPDLAVSIAFSRDRGHHSSGWWRNAEYEYCWHLSLAAKAYDKTLTQRQWRAAAFEHFPHDELRYWSQAFFGDDLKMAWLEPGGTDPNLTPEARRIHATMWHVRVFMEPRLLDARGEPFRACMPKGEVYDLTRWIDGLTPEKVDR